MSCNPHLQGLRLARCLAADHDSSLHRQWWSLGTGPSCCLLASFADCILSTLNLCIQGQGTHTCIHSSLDRLIFNVGPVPDPVPDLDRVWTFGTGTL